MSTTESTLFDRLNSMPDQLSCGLVERMEDDRARGWVNPYRAFDEDVIRREDRPADRNSIWRPSYVRDTEKILHLPAYNRYNGKTQVFSFRSNDDLSRRGLHVQLVSRVARGIGSLLGLNCDLIEAIALGHDTGHTPFGHAGERALDKLTPGGFKHYMQSLRVVDKLEKDGQGLNLTWEVRNGIVTHTRGEWAATREGRVVRFADHIAYMNHDIEDAVTAGVLRNEDIPAEITSVLGSTKSERITSLIMAIVEHGAEDIGMDAERAAAYEALKSGKLGGLGLDAFEIEPPTGSPLFELNNVVVTPHTGAHTQEATDHMANGAIKNLIDILSGNECPYIVNK